jgi:4-alpha-glucanotransferase
MVGRVVSEGIAVTSMLDEVARNLGIAGSYRDQDGRIQTVSDATKRALVAAFGIPADDVQAVGDFLARVRSGASAGLLAPPVTVLREHPSHVVLAAPAGLDAAQVRWTLTREDGQVDTGACELRALVSSGRTELPLPPDLARGYHRLDVALRAGEREATARSWIIVAPQRAYLPPAFEQDERPWGIALQLYAVRSARNWGIGDFTDLRELLVWGGRIGAAAIGVNPLHALFLDDPVHISPYSPSSRYYFNPLYLDVEAIDDLAYSNEAKALMRSASFQEELAAARAAELVDYRAVTKLKRGVFEAIHRTFRTRDGTDADLRREALAAFRRKHGESLTRFAIFQALREHRGARDPAQRDWRRWPAELRDPSSPAVAAFAAAHEAEVEFFAYLQWQIEVQLAACVESGRAAGLPIGLYLDLAVGTDAAGADAWAAPHLVASGATIGAPPDAYNRKGQNWGLPPLNAAALRASGFQPFAELLRANMRWAGALRIDHVLGLMRLFWIPEGGRPVDGAYVAYPFDELIAVVALESQRNRCLVIGEDLGTLPDGFQAAMREAGLLSYCLLYFERDASGRFRPPADYPVDALVSVSTHDLPTVWGFWSRRDLDEKERVGAYPDATSATAARGARVEEIEGLIAALLRERLIQPGQPRKVVPLEAILRFVARTPSRLLMVGLEDLLGVVDQANLPGTIDEHPNWRRRLPTDIEAIMADARVLSAVRILDAERPTKRRQAGT